jgi:hypothetical protein
MTPNGFWIAGSFSDMTFRFAISDFIGASNCHGPSLRMARERWIAEWKRGGHPISGNLADYV